jgi:hypothetical protein
MSRGNRVGPGGTDSFVVGFFNPASAADTTPILTTTAETLLTAQLGPGVYTGKTTTYTHWTAPWPCMISEVFYEGQLLASGDIANLRVRREDLAAYSTADDVIRNAVGGATTDAIRLTATAANQYQRVRYTGVPQDTSVAPYYATVTASSDTATGFLKGERVLAAGDRISVTNAMGAAGDSITHLRCYITLSKLDSV